MTWDVLCNLENGKVTVSKMLQGGSVGSMRGHPGDSGSEKSIVKVEEESMASTPTAKMTATSKPDCVDNLFMDEVSDS